jgi:UDP:flavonoid glycosyltransferase YjiC (YdhE family)
LLAQAALAIGPGGGGFVSKVAAAGVPMVVVPQAGDQREAAARLVDAGIGRVLRPERLTARRLRWAVVRHLADPRPAAAARNLAEQASHLGPDLAAHLVEQVMAGARPFASGPAEHLPD